MMRIQEMEGHELIEQLGELRSQERQGLVEFLLHVGEIDARRLWAEMACSSMHVYLTSRLGYSDPTASKRVKVARAARVFPLLLEAIGEGKLHLTGAYLLCDHLDEQNHSDLIESACGKSKADIEAKVAALCPKPAIEPRCRKLPRRRVVEVVADPLGMHNLSQTVAAPLESSDAGNSLDQPVSPPKKPTKPLRSEVTPVGEERWRVCFDLLGEEYELLKEAAELSGEKDTGRLILQALSQFVSSRRKRKFGETTKSRENGHKAECPEGFSPAKVDEVERTEVADRESSQSGTPSRLGESSMHEPKENRRRVRVESRYIKRSVKREVVARDGRQCSFRDARGQRCEEKSRLEFHHIEPFAKGGKSTADNIVLLCRGHNDWFARRDYGDEKIEDAIARSTSRKIGTFAEKLH